MKDWKGQNFLNWRHKFNIDGSTIIRMERKDFDFLIKFRKVYIYI